MTNAFEYGDALLAQPDGDGNESPESPQISNNQPYLNLALVSHFRYVVLDKRRGWA